MIAILALILILALFFGGGLAAGVHLLLWIAVALFLLWLIAHFVGGVPGRSRGFWGRW